MSNVDDLIYSPIEDDDPETHEDVGYDERFVHVDWLGGIEIFCPRHGPFRIAPQIVLRDMVAHTAPVNILSVVVNFNRE